MAKMHRELSASEPSCWKLKQTKACFVDARMVKLSAGSEIFEHWDSSGMLCRFARHLRAQLGDKFSFWNKLQTLRNSSEHNSKARKRSPAYTTTRRSGSWRQSRMAPLQKLIMTWQRMKQVPYGPIFDHQWWHEKTRRQAVTVSEASKNVTMCTCKQGRICATFWYVLIRVADWRTTGLLGCWSRSKWPEVVMGALFLCVPLEFPTFSRGGISPHQKAA